MIMAAEQREGLIIKGIAGFYYVKSGDEVFRCKARGIFKQKDIKPAVGDRVRLEIIPDNDDSLITHIFPRKNSFIRPFIANVDCFIIVAAAAEPSPVLQVIDRLFIMAEKSGTEALLCINKKDLAAESRGKKGIRAKESLRLLEEVYSPIYPVVELGALAGEGTERLRELIKGKTSAMAGPSGVGKSTILNALAPAAAAETGDISEKSKRGKHTTRHSELFYTGEDTFIFDTPGFTSFDILEADEYELQHFYPDIEAFAGNCRYSDCVHVSEPGCGVTEALKEGKISRIRYESYVSNLEEIRRSKQY